jgi:hypothetical protein
MKEQNGKAKFKNQTHLLEQLGPALRILRAGDRKGYTDSQYMDRRYL